MKHSTLVLILVFLLTQVYSRPIFDFAKSYVLRLTDFNINDQVHKIRRSTNQVSIVLFYKYDDGKSKEFSEAYDKWTNEYRGVFRIAAIDCEEYEAICKKEDVQEFPTIKVYPPIPMPVVKYQGELKVEALQKYGAKYLHSNVIEITNSNIKTFLGENPSVPKVLLFTDKKGTPMVYKGLSVSFERKLTFGIIRSSDTVVVQKYGIKEFPALVVVKTGEKKPFYFKGKYEFSDLFDFLNIHSEAFVPGGGSSQESHATKQWMTESLPQLNEKSAQDICFGTEFTCGIILTNGKPDATKTKSFEQLIALYDPKIDRGAKFKFMWMNASANKAWGDLLGYTGEDRFVFLIPGKRIRYTVHEGEINKNGIVNSIDKILGGDGRFTRITAVPKFESN